MAESEGLAPRSLPVPALEPPLCTCHDPGVPMLWKRDARQKGGGRWRCRIRNREYNRGWREANPEYFRTRYENLTGTEYAALLLRLRRWKALKRRAERHQRMEAFREAYASEEAMNHS